MSKLHSLSSLTLLGPQSPVSCSIVPLLFYFSWFGSNPRSWQGLSGSLICRCVTRTGIALTTPSKQFQQTAIMTTTMRQLSIIYFWVHHSWMFVWLLLYRHSLVDVHMAGGNVHMCIFVCTRWSQLFQILLKFSKSASQLQSTWQWLKCRLAVISIQSTPCEGCIMRWGGTRRTLTVKAPGGTRDTVGPLH